MFDWTDERVEVLRSCAAEGLSFGVIAERLGGGVTRNAVIGKAGRLGIVKKETTAVMVRRGVQRGERKLAKLRVAPERRTPFRAPKPAVEAPEVVSPPLAPAPLPEPTGPRVRLLDLRRGQCRWIADDPAGAETLFCGAPVARGAYCACHGVIAYRGTVNARRAA